MCLEFGYSEPDAVAQHTESANPEHALTPSDHTRIRIGQAAGKVKSIHLSMRACRATTHAYCLKRQVTRVRYLHTKVFSRCSFRLRSVHLFNRGPDPLTRLAAVASVRHSPGDSLFRFVALVATALEVAGATNAPPRRFALAVVLRSRVVCHAATRGHQRY